MLSHTTVDRYRFREAMSHLAASVHLVTTDGVAGRRGVTVTAVCSVSDQPATLLVCLNHTSAKNRVFDDNGLFAINVLGGRNEALARKFAGEGGLDSDERFAAGDWTKLVTGAPVLVGSIVSFDCRLIDSRVVATHRILIGEVVAVSEITHGDSLVYKDRHYRYLPEDVR